jgi:hypothetical protein
MNDVEFARRLASVRRHVAITTADAEVPGAREREGR